MNGLHITSRRSVLPAVSVRSPRNEVYIERKDSVMALSLVRPVAMYETGILGFLVGSKSLLHVFRTFTRLRRISEPSHLGSIIVWRGSGAPLSIDSLGRSLITRVLSGSVVLTGLISDSPTLRFQYMTRSFFNHTHISVASRGPASTFQSSGDGARCQANFR